MSRLHQILFILSLFTVTFTTAQLSTLTQTQLSGFCLSEAEGRSRLDPAQPLYNHTIRINLAFQEPYIAVWVLAAQLLLEEVYGYNTTLYSNPDNLQDNNVYAAIADNLVDVDFYHINNVLPQEPQWYLQYVTQERVVTDLGTHSDTLQPGIYFNTAAQLFNPQLILNDYQQYQMARGSDALAAMAIFRQQSWSILNLTGDNVMLSNLSDPTSIQCLPDNLYLEAGFPPQGCGTVYPGMFVPSVCTDNPQQDCLVVFTVPPTEASPGILQSIINNLHLNWTIAFVPQATLVALSLQQYTYLTFDVNLFPGLFHINYDFGPALGGLQPYATRLNFPTWDASCNADNNNTAYSGYHCDFPVSTISKYASSSLSVSAPRVYYLAQQMNIMPTDNDYVLTQMSMIEFANHSDLTSIACSWLRQNVATWSAWTLPPANCSVFDYEYNVQSCDVSTGTLTMEYSWLEPKACQYGVALPSNVSIPCAFPCPSSGAYMGWVSVYGILTLITLGLPGFQLLRPLIVSVKRWLDAFKGGASSQDTQARTMSPELFSRLILMMGVLVIQTELLVVLGPPSNQTCWSRHALVWVGASASTCAMYIQLRELCKQVYHKLQTQQAWKQLMPALSSLLLPVVLFVVASQMGQWNMLDATQLTAVGGGVFDQPYCSMIHASSWLLYVMIAFHGISGCYMLVIVFQCLTRILTDLDNLAEQKQRLLNRKRLLIQKRHRVRATANLTDLLRLVVGTCSMWVLLVIYTITTVYHEQDNNIWVTTINAAVAAASVVTLLSGFISGDAAVVLYRRLRPAVAQVLDAAPKRQQVANLEVCVESEAAADPASRSSHDSLGPLGTGTQLDNQFESLAGTLSDPVVRSFYRAFMEEAMDSENIEFLEAVQRHLSLCKKAMATGIKHQLEAVHGLLRSTDHISKTFIEPDAKRQINLSDSQVKSILAALQQTKSTYDAKGMSEMGEKEVRDLVGKLYSVFNKAVSEVCALMSVNSWPRFIASRTAREAEQVVQWSEGFDILEQRQQKAVLDRLSRRYHQMMSDVASTIKSSNGSYTGAVTELGGDDGAAGVDDHGHVPASDGAHTRQFSTMSGFNGVAQQRSRISAVRDSAAHRHGRQSHYAHGRGISIINFALPGSENNSSYADIADEMPGQLRT